MSMGAIRMGAFGLLAGLAFGGSAAWQVAYKRGHEAAAEKSLKIITAKDARLQKSSQEFAACAVANASYHSEVAKQLDAIAKEMSANAARDKAAQAANAKADKTVLEASAAARQKAEEAADAIRAKVETCVGAAVPAEFVGLLNDIIGAADLAASGPAASDN